MKCKQEGSDSVGSSPSKKSPSKRTTKTQNPSTQTLTSEISERINFQGTEGPSVQRGHGKLGEEQNSVDELHTEIQNNVISPVEFSQNNSKSESLKSIFSMEEFSSDDEIYLFQCPQNYDKLDFFGKNLDFTKLNPSITNKGEVYPLQLLDFNKTHITLALPKDTSGGALVKLPLKGHIIVQKAVDIYAVEPVVDDNSDKDTVKFPDDIKVRHPLLGIDWKAHIDLADYAFDRCNSKKKIKKRKQEKIAEENNVATIKVKEESSESEINSPKKKKKKYGT